MRRAARADGNGPPAEARPKDAAEALALLKEGNRRFVSNHLRHRANWRRLKQEHLKASQQPFATILACSDSRVPPELVFDQGFGDLFVIRVAGNIIATTYRASHATRHLQTPLVVIMGHESQGRHSGR